jgi:hypothetical protein
MTWNEQKMGLRSIWMIAAGTRVIKVENPKNVTSAKSDRDPVNRPNIVISRRIPLKACAELPLYSLQDLLMASIVLKSSAIAATGARAKRLETYATPERHIKNRGR